MLKTKSAFGLILIEINDQQTQNGHNIKNQILGFGSVLISLQLEHG